MANNGKYITIDNGRQKQEIAISVSAGAADANKLARLGADGKFDATLMAAGLAGDAKAFTTSEALSAGDMVNIWDSAGPKMRKADATTAGKEVNGFVTSAVASGATGVVIFEGTVTGLAGLTVGARYYLNTVAGTITTVPLTGAGNVHQYIGTAVSATELTFEADDGIILA